MIDKENTTIVNRVGKKADIEARVAQINARSRRPPRTTTVPRDNQGETAASIRMRTRRGWTDGARA